ncbi:MAG: tRNA lysidine(34) synthetase TilS [SAR324 cluster bacterium]|nr:tRNA lysidine(34) synthetase TilS [SAR324 cluster bacterium]
MTNNISKHDLLQNGHRILVCVSGGSDSVALLHILLDLQSTWNYELHLIHFDHGLRPESSEERHFVELLAKQYNLPCHTHASQTLKQESSGIQEKSRIWRMTTTEKTLAEIRGQWIATAHHGDDQAETLLLKWLRGCHLSNLRGMEWKNETYIRPLLNCSKLELQKYLQTKSQIWMEDTSNHSSKYLRNRIRLELLPLMKDLAKGELHSRMQDLSEQSAQLKEWIEDIKNILWPESINWHHGIFVEELKQASPMVQSAVLHNITASLGLDALDYLLVKQILEQLQTEKNQWELHLPGKTILRCEGKKLFVPPSTTISPETTVINEIQITHCLSPGWQIDCRYLERTETISLDGMVLFNISPTTELIFRYRRDGDYFHPHWKNKPVKVKDFLRDQGIPLHQRNQIPLVCYKNEILGIYPHFRGKPFHHDKKKHLPLYVRVDHRK